MRVPLTGRKGWFIATVAWLLVAAWLLIIFWSVRPYHHIRFTAFQSDADTYTAGEVVTLTNEFCWDGTPFRALRVIVGPIAESEVGVVRFDQGYAIPEVADRYRQTGCSDSTVRVALPTTLTPGVYQIRYEVSYKPAWNPVRVVRTENTSNEFTVTPSERG